MGKGLVFWDVKTFDNEITHFDFDPGFSEAVSKETDEHKKGSHD
jgi:hypothetical protein